MHIDVFTPVCFNPFTDSFYETGNQVHEWVLTRARAHFAEEAKRKLQVTDRGSFARYREERRQRFIQMVGPLAEIPAAPDADVTGVLERDAYQIRKLIFRGRSGMPVTANVYVPTHRAESPVPGVLMCCGHSVDGKAAEKYQRVCQSLVRAGFVVLIFDSPSHGEMVQCLDTSNGEPLVGLNTREHSYLQLAAFALDRNIMREFINNARAGLDVLTALPEVDAARIGVTGNSGGGHMTQALMMVDDRVQAAMPCCSQTTREKYLETGIRAYDGEQNYFGCIPAGLDYDDFFAAFAPRPLRIGAAAHDFFAIEGVLEAVERARRMYRLLDAEDRIDVCIAEEELHGYTDPLRRGCVEWFQRHFLGQATAPEHEKFHIESAATLQCTRSGQVYLDYPDAPTLLDLLSEEWRAARARAAAAESPPTPATLRRLLNLAEKIEPPQHVRRKAQTGRDGITSERIFFFSEPNIICTGVIYKSAANILRAMLLLIPDGTEGQTPHAAWINAQVNGGAMVLVFDPRGTGAVRMRQRNPGTGLGFKSTEFRVASDHFLLGTSLASKRAYDVLRAAAYLRNRPECGTHTTVTVEGRGWPSLYGLVAAAVDERLQAGQLTGLPDSWKDLFTSQSRDPEIYAESLILPELRGELDITDLKRLAT